MSEFIIENGILKNYIGTSSHVTVPDGVTTIAKNAFTCQKLESIYIPLTVKNIENDAFSKCSRLQSLDIPDSVTSIATRAFYECEKLSRVKLSNSITAINNWTFYRCESLSHIDIPNSVTEIGGWAFHGCKSLKSISIPGSVKRIGHAAFYGASSLESMTIPKNIVKLGMNFLYGCTSLKYLYNYSAFPVLKSIEPEAPLQGGFLPGETFNFFDTRYKLLAVICYLSSSELYSDEEKRLYENYIKLQNISIVKKLIERKCFGGISEILKHGYVKPENLEKLLDFSTSLDSVEATALLLNFKAEHCSFEKERKKELDKMLQSLND